MKCKLCYKTKIFADYYYDTDTNRFYHVSPTEYTRQPKPISLTIGDRHLSYHPSEPIGHPLTMTRDKFGNIVCLVEGTYYRADYLVAYTVYGQVPNAIRVLHLDRDNDNFGWDNLVWLTREDILASYLDKYKVESLDEIPEIWKEMVAPRNSSIRFEISNFGAVKRNGELIPLRTDSGGYLQTSYQDEKTHERAILLVHVCVASLFVENYDPDTCNIVNHIDANKQNNHFWNLEWVSQSENMIHAYTAGVMRNEPRSEEMIDRLCQALARGTPRKEICATFGVDPKFVSKIYTRKIWNSISSKYTFPAKSFDADDKDRIRLLMGRGMMPKEIAATMGIPYDTKFIALYERIKRHVNHAAGHRERAEEFGQR